MLKRTYFGTPQLFSKHLNRESRFLQKILNKNSPKRTHRIVNTPLPTLFTEKNNTFINKRRINVLNKLFMSYITDILTTGEIDPIIAEKGIEVSKVAISPDFQNINVYWYSSLLYEEEIIDHNFGNAAKTIHHELSQLRLMGFIPKINFVRDKRKNKIEDVEKLLRTVSLYHIHHSHEKDDPNQMNGESLVTHLPEMGSNVYGLEHEKIMKKIIIAKGKRINNPPQNFDKSESSDCCDPQEKS